MFLPEADVLKHEGVVHAYKDQWWSVMPEKGLIFYCPGSSKGLDLCEAFPQCNPSEVTTRKLQQQLYPGAETKFFPLVLQPLKLKFFPLMQQPLDLKDLL